MVCAAGGNGAVMPSSPAPVPMRNARAEATIERVVGVLTPAAYVLDRSKAQGRVINLPGQRGALAGREVVFCSYGVAGLIHDQDLLTIYFVRRHFQLIAEAVSQGE